MPKKGERKKKIKIKKIKNERSFQKIGAALRNLSTYKEHRSAYKK